MKELRNSLIVWFLYLLLMHVFMYKALIPNTVFFGTDRQVQSQTFSVAVEKEIERNKEFPFWTNHILGGMPTAASFFTHKPQLIDYIWNTVTFPIGFTTNKIATLFNLDHSDYSILWWMSIFGLFMFIYLRYLKLSLLASFIGGLSFMSCTGLISLIYPGHLTGKTYLIGYLPLILFFISYAFEKKISIMFFGIASFIYARTMIFHIQIFFLLSVSLVIYLFFKILFDYLEKKDWKRAGKFVVLSGIFFAMGFLLNADQLLPRMEFKKYTHRGAETKVSEMDKAAMPGVDPDLEKYYFVTSFSQPPEDLLGLFMRYPFGMGKPYGGVLKEVEEIPYYRGRYELRLSLEYVGIFVFLLAILGAIKYFGMREVKLIVILGITSILLSLGKYTILFDFLYKMPGFKNFRIPLVYIMVSYFSFAALAGFGFQAIEDFIKDNKKGFLKKFLITLFFINVLITVLATIGSIYENETIQFLLNFEIVHEMLWGIYSDLKQRYALFLYNLFYMLICMWIFWLVLFLVYKKKISNKITFGLLALAISLDLWSLNNKFIILIPKEQNVKEFMAEDNLVKFLKHDKSLFRIKSNVDEVNNRWLLFGISNIEGYHPTPLKTFEDVYSQMNFTNNIDSLLNIKYLILSPQDSLIPLLENNVYLKNKYRKEVETSMYSISAKSEKPVVIYRNTQDYGRFFFVYNFAVIDDDKALVLLASPNFNPREIALLSEKPKESFILTRGNVEKIEVKRYSPNEVIIETECDGNGLLIFSENWYPAWKAYIGGQKTHIYRAYVTLRAVFVPKGKHEIRFKYESETLFWGEMLFFLGLAVFFVSIFFECFSIRVKSKK